ncbi:MAG TPA: S24/S26 family peptidase [Terriglobales bacterium]|nr:S24/S26 family peptidase [Terriglobales bacterium]
MAVVPTPESVRCELLAETVRRHGRARLRVQGTSMLPSLRPGDLLQIECRLPAEIEAGAIVLYAREQRLFAHRLLRKQVLGALVVRGDRLARPDPPVRPEELLGEVTWVQRGARGFAPARRPGWGAALLRLVSRFSDLPAGLWLRLACPGARVPLPEVVAETVAPR